MLSPYNCDKVNSIITYKILSRGMLICQAFHPKVAQSNGIYLKVRRNMGGSS